jgi:hypothetical protein
MNRPRLRWMLGQGQALRELVGRHPGFARNYGDTISISRRRKRVDQPPIRAVAINFSQGLFRIIRSGQEHSPMRIAHPFIMISHVIGSLRVIHNFGPTPRLFSANTFRIS